MPLPYSSLPVWSPVFLYRVHMLSLHYCFLPLSKNVQLGVSMIVYSIVTTVTSCLYTVCVWMYHTFGRLPLPSNAKCDLGIVFDLVLVLVFDWIYCIHRLYRRFAPFSISLLSHVLPRGNRVNLALSDCMIFSHCFRVQSLWKILYKVFSSLRD